MISTQTANRFKRLLAQLSEKDRGALFAVIESVLDSDSPSSTHASMLSGFFRRHDYEWLKSECEACGSKNDCLECKITDDDPLTLEVSRPVVEVWTFKESGKYYSSKRSFLHEGHFQAAKYGLLDLFRTNDPTVREYSPVTTAFGSEEFSHFVHLSLPAKMEGFCTSLITPANRRSFLSKNPHTVFHPNSGAAPIDTGCNPNNPCGQRWCSSCQ